MACAALAPELMAKAAGKKAGRRSVPGTLPRLSYDVIVAGAGPGGIASAVAAARNGAKVLLLEEDMTPGGAPVDMFVTFMCGGPRVGILGNALLVYFFRYSGNQIVIWILSFLWYYACFLLLPSYIYASYFDAEDMERADMDEEEFTEVG